MSIEYSPTWYRLMRAFAALLFLGLLAIAWTSDTREVGLDLTFKLELTAAAFVLGGGLWMYAAQYKENAEAEARMRESVMRSLATGLQSDSDTNPEQHD